MALYRQHIPQISGDLFLTDGGIETTLIFHEGFDLPFFAAFTLLENAHGYSTLQKYFRTYASLARDYEVGCILESPTWRASSDWGDKLGYSDAALAELNRRAVRLLHDVRHDYEDTTTPIVISGCIGPRGDGYNPAFLMHAKEAERYHTRQIQTLRDAEADLITAITMTYPAEAIGIVRAAQAAGMPVVVSFTVETDGCLPTGQTLQAAITEVDQATHQAPLYYMLNCAHPSHFRGVLQSGEAWTTRLRGLRANASTKSHAELDEATELDEGDPEALGRQYQELREALPYCTILGGCCGTDHRHIAAIFDACLTHEALPQVALGRHSLKPPAAALLEGH